MSGSFPPCIIDFKRVWQLLTYCWLCYNLERQEVKEGKDWRLLLFSLACTIRFIWTEQRIKENLCKLLEFEGVLSILLKITYVVLGITQMCGFSMSLIFLIPGKILIQIFPEKNLKPHTAAVNLPWVFPYSNSILTSWRHCEPLLLFCLENNRQCDPDSHLVFQLLMWFRK